MRQAGRLVAGLPSLRVVRNGNLPRLSSLHAMLRSMKTKKLVLDRIARSLAWFYPECTDEFLCPTCLTRVRVANADRITIAHILPRSAGGGLTTLLCASCNSGFGSRQDKWIGEHLRIVLGKGSILDAKWQKGHFAIGGVRVAGRYRVLPDGGLNFRYWPNKTSPEAVRAVEEQFAKSTIQMTIPIPLLESQNQELVSCGFLTAAYLMWFRELGYSWALQAHLDPVREQIRRPDDRILPRNFSAACPGQVFAEPWIGIGRVADELALLAGLADRIVLLPPFDRKDLYTCLPSDYRGLRAEDITFIRFFKHHSFPGPVAVVFGDRFVVAPDVFFRTPSAPMILFPPDGSDPCILWPRTKEEFNRDGERPNTFTIDMRVVALPDGETGRPQAG